MKNKFQIAMTLALILAMVFNSLALADNVQNDVVVGGNDTITTGGSTTINYKITANNGDGQTGCNAADTSPATITINTPAGVTVDTSGTPGNQITLTFTSCGTNQSANFTSSTSGIYVITVSVSDSGTGSYNVNPATFALKVLAPVDSTPPSITPNVTGTLGSNGWYVSNVDVSWTVSDPDSTVTSTTGCGSSTVDTDTSDSTFTCSATSAGGSNSQSITIKRDATSPVISGSAAPAPNGAGWNNTDVDVTFTCSDGTSGIATCGPDQTLSTNGAGQSASGNAVDNAGNSASATVSDIAIDKELPTIHASLPADNGNGWYNGSVTVTFDCSDGYSGVAYCESDYTFTGEGSGLSYTGQAGDVADNQNSTEVSVNIDATAPVITLVSRKPANANGWNNTDVALEWSCTDTGSGVVEATINVLVSSEGAGQSASATCEDLAGNTSSDTQTDIHIDKTAPSVSAEALPAANSNGWNNTDVTVTFSGTDDLSGIDSCDAPAVLSSDGAGQSASGSCTDLAGNSANASVSDINIDKTAPTASASASPAANAFGWNNTDVTVTFNGTDDISGIETCDTAVVLNTEGAGQSASGTCTDKAGNVSDLTTANNINIDKTLPIVALAGGPANGASYYFGFVPAAPTCSASDALSGLAAACAVSGYGTSLGSHTVTASATDKADNSASASASYTVLGWTLNGFYQPVDMGTNVWNTVKNGSTVPLKFEIFAGSMELTNTSYVQSLQAYQVSCSAGGSEDAIETVATGSTSLRYDSTSGQFIFNWQTPRKAGTCYKVVMTTLDGSSLTAYFKLK